MKKIILTIDSQNNLIDDNGSILLSNITNMNYVYKEYEEQNEILKLVSMGISASDLIKLKTNELI